MEMPDTVYVQVGMYGGHDLFVNRTPHGALYRNIGAGFAAGAQVGVYKLERIVKIAAGIVESSVEPPVVIEQPASETQ